MEVGDEFFECPDAMTMSTLSTKEGGFEQWHTIELGPGTPVGVGLCVSGLSEHFRRAQKGNDGRKWTHFSSTLEIFHLRQER